MQVTVASNFNEYVAVMAANSPHGLMMDLWRRLDLAVGEYLDSSGSTVNRRNRSAIEETLALDPAFGSRFADSLRRLRLLRNGVAHQPIYHHSSEDAIGYARHAFALIGVIGRRISCLEGAAITKHESATISRCVTDTD